MKKTDSLHNEFQRCAHKLIGVLGVICRQVGVHEVRLSHGPLLPRMSTGQVRTYSDCVDRIQSASVFTSCGEKLQHWQAMTWCLIQCAFAPLLASRVLPPICGGSIFATNGVIVHVSHGAVDRGRYGVTLEAVREEMKAGTWLCPHCYEDDHPDEVQLSLCWWKVLDAFHRLGCSALCSASTIVPNKHTIPFGCCSEAVAACAAVS